MIQKRRRRTRSEHPRVIIYARKRPDGPTKHRARWRDPDTGRVRYLTLDGTRMRLNSVEARRAWARKKSESIAARVAEIKAGSSRVSPTDLDGAIKKYVKAKKTECRPRTVAAATMVLGRFRHWLGPSVKATTDITPAVVAEFRDHVIALTRTVSEPGAKRGKRMKTRRPLSPYTRNRMLTVLGTCLREWRRRRMIKMTSDEIADCLRPVRVDRRLPAYLTTDALRQLLDAARRHDATVYKATRAELKGKRPRGSTIRYDPSAPFILAVLLTGARRSEIEGLTWDEVDLAAKNIVLDPSRVKTRRGRVIDISITPSLVAYLESQRLRSGGATHVFGPWASGNLAASTRRRLLRDYDAPPSFTWQALRRTAATFVTCWVRGGPWISARRCGHSILVSESSYAGLVTVDPAARTLEEAMRIDKLADEIMGRRAQDAMQLSVSTG